MNRPYGFPRLVGLEEEAVELGFVPELLDTDGAGLRVGAAGRDTLAGARAGADGRPTVGVVRLGAAGVTRRVTDGLLVVGRRLLVDVGLVIVADRLAADVVRRVDVICRRTSVVRTGLTSLLDGVVARRVVATLP